jgi:hypothetical protein
MLRYLGGDQYNFDLEDGTSIVINECDLKSLVLESYKLTHNDATELNPALKECEDKLTRFEDYVIGYSGVVDELIGFLDNDGVINKTDRDDCDTLISAIENAYGFVASEIS